MPNLNNTLYNAAYIGFIEGAVAGRPLGDPTAADYLILTQAAQAFATEVDGKIPFDALITTANGTPTMLAESSDTVSANILTRFTLLKGIAHAAMHGRPLTDPTAADYNAMATAVVALYTEALLLLVTP